MAGFNRIADVLEEWDWLRRAGVPVEDAAPRLGMTYNALDLALHRAADDPRAKHDGHLCWLAKKEKESEPVSATLDIIETGKTHPSARVRSAAKRAEQALTALNDALARERTRDAARAEVERLEEQLRAAKAKLRGTPVDQVDSDEPEPKAVRAWAKLNGIAVPPVGRIPRDVLDAYREAS